MHFEATEFGARLRNLRNEAGMTQEALAEELHFSIEHLSKLERGVRSPSIDLIIEIACYFKVSTDYLLLGTKPDKEKSREKLLQMAAQLSEMAKYL